VGVLLTTITFVPSAERSGFDDGTLPRAKSQQLQKPLASMPASQGGMQRRALLKFMGKVADSITIWQ
jgi:hypothetical protein